MNSLGLRSNECIDGIVVIKERVCSDHFSFTFFRLCDQYVKPSFIRREFDPAIQVQSNCTKYKITENCNHHHSDWLEVQSNCTNTAIQVY